MKLNQKLDNILLDGENFILIGGPPCRYSLAGIKNVRKGNQLKVSTKNTSIADIQTKLTKEFYQDKRHTLYKEYLKIICRYQPAIFVMENVKGMGSARSGPSEKAGSIFSNIIHGLRNPFDAVKVRTRSNQKPKGYKLYSIQEVEKDLFSEDEILKPEDCLVKSEQFGIQRDIDHNNWCKIRPSTIPRKLKPSNSTKTVRDAIGTMPKIRSGLSKEPDSCALWQEVIIEQVKRLIGQTPFDHQLKTQLLE